MAGEKLAMASVFRHPARLVLLYSMPRSGSTFVESVLAPWFAQVHGHRHLSEFFNLNFCGARVVRGEFEVDTTAWHPNGYSDALSEVTIATERAQRMHQLLASTEGSYFLKVLGAQLPPEHMASLTRRCDIVFSERRDLWQHLLSYLISFQTNQYYERERISWEEGALVASRDFFQRFLWLFERYQKLRSVFSEAPVIVFEDLIAQGEAFCEGFGPERISWQDQWRPERQNLRDKELAFSNLSELKSWYRESALMRWHPLDP